MDRSQKQVVGTIISLEASDMAAAVPLSFPEIHFSEQEKQEKRWKKWLSRVRNLLVTMATIDK